MSSEKNNAGQERTRREKLKGEFSDRLSTARSGSAKNKCVFYYYGERGSGLTEFKKELVKEAQKESCTVLELDFSSDAPGPMAALESLRRKLKKKVDFWRCGVVMRGLGRNWEENLRGPGVLCSFLLILLVNGAMQIVKDRWNGALLVFASTVFGALGGVSGKAIVEGIKHSRDRYRFQKKYPNINIGKKGGQLARLKSIVVDNDADEWSPEDKMERQSWLPELFAEDVNEWLEKEHSGETLCVFIDSYDAHANGDRAGDEWLYGKHGLCRHLKHAVFVIIGHEPLSWVAGDGNSDNFWKEEAESKEGAQTNEAQQTESEEDAQTNGEQKGVLLCRPIDRWDRDQSIAFLKEQGVPNDNDLWETLYELTDGWPELLDKWCKVFASGDKSGALSKEQREKLVEWGKAFVEVHWHVKISDSVYLMAGMRRWTRELLECAIWASGVGINDDIEDVMKELGAKELITRESADVYSMKNESIRIILSRNTILEQPQRAAAYKALIGTNTVSGTEAAYYLWKEDKMGKEDKKGEEDKKTRAKDLAARLKLHAEDLANANNANERADTDAMARVNEIYRHRPDVIEDFQRIQHEEQEEKRQALFKQIDRLYEEAVDVYTTVLGEDDNIRLAAMNYWAINCNNFGEHRKAEALASEALASCEEILQKMGPEERRKSPIDRTWRYTEKTLSNARKELGEET